MMPGSVGVAPPPVHIHNNFAELMLIVGLDDNTGLIQASKEDDDSEILEHLYFQDYEPQVLSAVSSTTMMHFFPHPRQDTEYPEINLTESIYAGSDDAVLAARIDKKLMRASTSRNFRSVSVNPLGISRLMSIRRPIAKKKFLVTSKQSQMASYEFPVSDEVIKAITTFCFPENMKIYKKNQPSFAHFLVLTDMSGQKTYATCVTFCRPFVVEKDDQNNLYVNLDPNEDMLSKGQYRCYIPHCCVLISKFPYFSTMKDVLSYMVSLIQKRQEDMYSYIKEFTHLLTLTPVPPAGQVAVEVKLHNNIPFLIYPADKADKPVTDIPLHLVFLSFADSEILKILSAILMEERIVFLSKSYALLTVISESFLNFILPFRWRFTYVPVLSSKALDLLEAPGTFIMGCHVVHQHLVAQVEGLVVANIDTGTVAVNPEPDSDLEAYENIAGLTRIPDIPKDPADSFRNVCRKARVQFDLLDMQRPTCHDMADEMKIRQERIRKLNTEISVGCLELMVNLFRCVVVDLRGVEQKSFNSQKFLECVEGSDKLFYEQVLNRDMFKAFLQRRIQDKSDYWTEFEVKTRQLLKPVIANNPSNNRRRSSKQAVSMASNTAVEHKELVIFKLPQKSVVKRYIGQSISQLDRALKTCQDYHERATFLYLRAVFHFANIDCLKAMEDILTLASVDKTLVPKLLVYEVQKSLSESDILKVKQMKNHHILLDVFGEDTNHGETRRIATPLYNEGVMIPDGDLSYQQFVEYVSNNEMTQDHDIISKLFLALTGTPQDTFLRHETFEAFCLCWQENQEQCNKVMDHRDLPESETVLKVSQLCKTDLGTGRVVLTDKRLLLMRDASRNFKDIIKLKNIDSVEKCQLHSFLSAVDALRIHGKGNFKFTAWLKEERNHIYLLIKEMWAGKIVSDATKDLVIIQQAAENVLLLDAVIKSGQEATSSHYNIVEASANQMCVYTKYEADGLHRLSEETTEALMEKLDPNVGEPERTSIQSLLYTPGDGSVSPRLWCGLVSGKIRVFHAISWTLEKEVFQTKKSLSCLTAVGKKQVWVGSYGISIIDIETLQSKRLLTDHGEFVIDIFVTDSHTYSGSLDGVILMWDVQKLTVAKRLELNLQGNETLRSIKYSNSHLWCGVWKAIYQLNLSGEVVQKIDFSIPDPTISPVEMECFIVLENGELWTGCRRDNKLVVIDSRDVEKPKIIPINLKSKSQGISVLVHLEDRIWVGTKSGHIFVINIHTKLQHRELKAHNDAVRALCCLENRYVMSGAGSRDGKIAVWNPQDTRTQSGRFLLAHD